MSPLLLAAPVVAQIPPIPPNSPEPVLPDSPQSPNSELLPPPEQLLQPNQNPQTPNLPTPEDIPGEIQVQRFEVIGSSVFSQEEFNELLKEFTEEPISFAELLRTQDKITQYYFEQGYITSGAFVPPQELADGVVQIQVIEGRVDEVVIEGLQRLKPSYIRSRIELGSQTPLNQNRLFEALQLLQLDPRIATLAVELAAGSRPGVSVLIVSIEENDGFSGQLTLDNQRSPSVGTFRRRLQASHNNLLGYGDTLSVGYTNTDGSNALDDFNYIFPINPRNGTVGFRHSRTRTNIIEEPFNILDIQSKSLSYELTYRQPLKQTPTEEFAVGVTVSRQESATTLLEIPFPLTEGADNNGELKISAMRFFQEYTARSSQEVFALRSQFSFGVGLLNSTINEDAPDSNFFSWRGQAQYLRLLTPDTILLLRGDLQLADQSLVSLEQFSIGGAATVRGYRQDSLLADNGLFASAEVRFPILRIPNWETNLQLAPFMDFGTVWNNRNSASNLATSTLTSVGLGLRLGVGDDFSAQLDWGIPLVDLNSSGDSLQENGIYFSINYQLF
ncbi:MAG: ShlB/FhaC/HecB family hemolysin secretion/activation protein [Spirulinaceae cyanobacterium]